MTLTVHAWPSAAVGLLPNQDSGVNTEVRSDYVQRQAFMRSFRSLWNYREVDGVKIPFVFIRNLGPLEPPHGGVLEDVRINVPLDETFFLPPDFRK